MALIRALRHAALGLAAAIALSAPASAQDADRPTAEEPQFFDDWGFRCSGEGEVDSCEIFQTLVVSEGQQRLLHMAIGYVQGVERPIGVMVVPLGVALPPGLTIQIDDGEQQTFEFERCDQAGCRVELLMGSDLIEGMRAGGTMNVTVVDASRQGIQIPVSLSGFTAAMTALQEARPAPAAGDGDGG
jgi:invasion protein IalB